MRDANLAAGLVLLDQKEAPHREVEIKPKARRLINEVDVLAKVADKGFLRSYMDYCADSTDAPHIFHLGVGVGILGAALGNNVRIPSWARQEIYPNIWLVLIAPSGFMRKSASLRLGKRLLAHSVPKALLPDDWTPEKLASILQDSPAGLLTISEFTRILAMLERDYNLGSKEMLTELYDSPAEWVVERQKTRKRIIENAAVSLLGATTSDWLEDRVKSKDLRGGFLARFLFLPATKRGPRVTKRPGITHTIRLSLTDHLKAVAELEGQADFSEVWEDFDDWLYRYEVMAESGGMPPELAGMYSRTGTTTLKLALIMQASLRPQLEITDEAMRKAITFIEFVHNVTAKVTGSFADDWFGKQLNRARQFLQDQGGEASREELFRYMRIEKRRLDAVIETLREQGFLEVGKGESTGGRPPTVYRLINT